MTGTTVVGFNGSDTSRAAVGIAAERWAPVEG
jgi:hypothetical protein